MTEIERLRLYLRDPDCKAFDDAELHDLLTTTGDFYEAVGLGWLLIGSSIASVSGGTGALMSKTVGKVSETYGSADSRTTYSTAFKLAEYWFSRSGVHSASWYSMEPATPGFIADTLQVIKAIHGSTHYPSLDLSRLIGVGW